MIRRAGQGQSHEAQVEALVLGMAPLGDVSTAVGGGDEGVEVGRVIDQGLGIDAELVHRRLDVGLLDCLHQRGVDQVHGVPEALGGPGLRGRGQDAVKHASVVVGDEATLGAGGHRPVDGGGLQVGPHAEARCLGPEEGIDPQAEVDAVGQGPHGGGGPELDDIDRLRLEGGVEGRLDRLDGAQVALAHHPGLAVHPGRVGGVPVGPAVLDLLHQRRHRATKGTTHLKKSGGYSTNYKNSGHMKTPMTGGTTTRR